MTTAQPTEVTAELFGHTVTITRSAGTDGAVLILIDTPHDDVNADEEPACRVLLNDDAIHEGTPYADATEED